MVMAQVPEQVQSYTFKDDVGLDPDEQTRVSYRVLNMVQQLDLNKALEIKDELDALGNVVTAPVDKLNQQTGETEVVDEPQTRITIVDGSIIEDMLLKNIIEVVNYKLAMPDGTMSEIKWNVNTAKSVKAEQLNLMDAQHKLELAVYMMSSTTGLSAAEAKNSNGQSKQTT